MIITIGGEKGGPGKTTVATHLAVWFAQQGKDILLVNTDKQNTAGDWVAIRDEEHGDKPRIPIVSLLAAKGGNIAKDLVDLRGKYDHVIVDAAGRDSAEQRSALVVTDILMVPTRPSTFDVWTMETMNELLDNVDSIRQTDLKAYVFANQVPPTSKDRARGEMVEIMREWPRFQLLNSLVVTRQAFQNAASLGLTVGEMPRPDTKARTEVHSVFEEVFHGDQVKAA